MRQSSLAIGVSVALLCVAYGVQVQAANADDEADRAQQLAAAGQWAEAIDAYGTFLSHTAPAAYRDKKDFAWIADAYTKTAPADDAAIRKLVDESLVKHKGQAIYEWRLHRLLADLADRRGDKETEQKELDAAIAAYPPELGPDPSRLSSLQHLYNQRTLLTAEQDAKAAEDYALDAFGKDRRFVYFFTPTWQRWYQQHNQAGGYADLIARVQKAYEQKLSSASTAQQRRLLTQYAAQQRQETENERK